MQDSWQLADGLVDRSPAGHQRTRAQLLKVRMAPLIEQKQLDTTGKRLASTTRQA